MAHEKITCPFCGGMVTVGSVCEYCGNFVSSTSFKVDGEKKTQYTLQNKKPLGLFKIQKMGNGVCWIQKDCKLFLLNMIVCV